MKKLILLILLLISSKSIANSIDCAMSGMTFLPMEREISLNSMFIIEGYSFSQKTINSFKNREIYLESTNGLKVELVLKEILKGQMELTQAIFKPKKSLAPNTTYFLKYKNQTKEESNEMFKWNSKTNKREKVHWKTSTNKELQTLNTDLKISFEKTEVKLYGCGPSSNAIFKVENNKISEIWYKTDLIDLSTNKKTTYYIRERKNNLYVGHGMCSGAFKFKSVGKYKVRFTPMNADGKSLKTTNWFVFKTPTSKSPFGF